jgi:hypothetical protein
MQVHPLALVDSEFPILTNIIYNESGQFVGEEPVQALRFISLINGWTGAHVVLEDFVLRQFNQDKDLLSPVRITAMIEYGMFEKRLGVSSRQQPSEAKNVATDDRLKAWGLYRSEGAQQHARDAVRHAITWMRKCKQDPKLRAECWPHLFGVGAEFGPDQ